MPRLTYTPEGADPKVWDFSFGRLLSPERIAVEKLTGAGWADVQRGYWANQGVVIHALLYVLLKRDVPTLKPEQVVFCDDEIDLDLNDDEAVDALAVLRQKDRLSDEESDALVSLEARLPAREEDLPKGV